MPLHQNSQSFPAGLVSGWRQIPQNKAGASLFLLQTFTVSYATPPEQPIFSGWTGEWPAPYTAKQGRNKSFSCLLSLQILAQMAAP
jgi:hypothetical protein